MTTRMLKNTTKTKCQAYLPAVLGLHVRGVETPVGENVLDEDGGSKNIHGIT